MAYSFQYIPREDNRQNIPHITSQMLDKFRETIANDLWMKIADNTATLSEKLTLEEYNSPGGTNPGAWHHEIAMGIGLQQPIGWLLTDVTSWHK